ncbi:MAG: nucleoside-diphosphate sugar epimerase/dehydratase [Pontibacterium sp.]
MSTEYQAHCLSKHVQFQSRLKVVAFIDEEPWSHRTLINGGRVHYPSELLALVKKYQVKVLIVFDHDKPFNDRALTAQLQKEGVAIITVPRISDPINMHDYILAKLV